MILWVDVEEFQKVASKMIITHNSNLFYLHLQDFLQYKSNLENMQQEFLIALT